MPTNLLKFFGFRGWVLHVLEEQLSLVDGSPRKLGDLRVHGLLELQGIQEPARQDLGSMFGLWACATAGKNHLMDILNKGV